jgi:copper resistance protein C
MGYAMNSKVRTLSFCFVALLGFGLGTTGAAAHSRLTKSDPAARAVLETAPKELKLWFNEQVEPAFAKMWIGTEDGSCIEQKTCVALTSRGDSSDPKLLIVTLPDNVPAGVVVIGYHVLSVDGHTVDDKVSFTVKPQ